MLKTLLILCGVLVMSVTGLQAQGARGSAGHAGSVGRAGFVERGGPLVSARPSSYRGGYNHGGGYYHGGGHHGGHRGHYYYLSGVPYFYPFGYPYYAGGFYGGYGDGFGYGYGGGGYPYDNGTYNGRIADDSDGDGNNNGQPNGGSLPEAVQRQLSKRGYYKGSVDGQFGPESRGALSRFQRKQGLKETGKIDEATLQALGFTDRN